MSQQKAMSKRMFGVGIMLTGILFLAVALIMGIEFPKYVFNKNLKDLCILNSKHRLYQNWLRDAFRVKTNRVWYWELDNKDEFLYSSAKPKFVERGPYVYIEHQQKINVSFTVNTVQFYLRRWQTFDGRRTTAECGPDCTETDNITVLNTDYFRRVAKFGGDVNFALHLGPKTLQSSLDTITDLHGGNLSETLQLLGRLNDTLVRWAEELTFPEHFSQLGFGGWVNMSDTTYKRRLLEHRRWSDFSVVEMAGLYSILTNPILLGTRENLLTSSSYANECNVNTDVPNIISNSGESSETFQYEGNSKACSFLACIDRYVTQQKSFVHAITHTTNLTETLARYLCTNTTNACLRLPNDSVSFDAYILTIHDYIYKHITRLSFHRNIVFDNRDLVYTRPQSQLALGYNVTVTNTANSGRNQRNHFVPGILENTSSETDVRWRSNKYSLYNCYDAIEAYTNFRWRAYDGRAYATSTQFPGASPTERQIWSFRRSLPPGKALEACQNYRLQDSAYDFFIPEYWRKLPFDVTDDHYIRGQLVQTLQLNRSAFQDYDAYLDSDGLQSMQGTYGYRSWVSLPHFLYADSTLPDYFGMRPSHKAHSMMMHVEPVTGTVWGSTIRYQHNVGILPAYVSVRRHQVALSVNDTGLPLPVFWVDQSFTYTSAGVAEYDDRSGRLLRAACGGLIGMSFLACLIVIIGILAATVTVRGGRVMPVNEEEAL